MNQYTIDGYTRISKARARRGGGPVLKTALFVLALPVLIILECARR